MKKKSKKFKQSLELFFSKNKDLLENKDKKIFALEVLSNFKFSQKYSMLRANFIKGCA